MVCLGWFKDQTFWIVQICPVGKVTVHVQTALKRLAARILEIGVQSGTNRVIAHLKQCDGSLLETPYQWGTNRVIPITSSKLSVTAHQGFFSR